ncbi:MAG: hypothetical protein ACLP0B_17970 [Steroidobacteraceae bacterium]
MADQNIHIGKGGPAPAASVKEIHARSQAQLALWRTITGAILLAGLIIGYFVGVYNGKDIPALLTIIAAGIGALLGGRDKSGPL